MEASSTTTGNIGFVRGLEVIHYPVNLLINLASIEAQDRYMIHGSAGAFLDPCDLLDDAFQFCTRMRRDNTWSCLSIDERSSVERFEIELSRRADCVGRHDYSTIRNLVELDRDWAILREAGHNMFILFGGTSPA